MPCLSKEVWFHVIHNVYLVYKGLKNKAVQCTMYTMEKQGGMFFVDCVACTRIGTVYVYMEFVFAVIVCLTMEAGNVATAERGKTCQTSP